MLTAFPTGDSAGAAAGVASVVGIKSQHVHAQLLPQHKAELIRQLQQNGHTVYITDPARLFQLDDLCTNRWLLLGMVSMIRLH